MVAPSTRWPLWRERLIWTLLFVLAGIAMDASRLNPVCEDSPGYIEPAKALIATGGYPSVVRPPAYSIFLADHLALAGHHGLAVSVWSQRLLWLACILFLYPIPDPNHRHAVRFWRIGTAVALFMPQVLVNESVYLSDALFTILICAGLFFSRRLSRTGRPLDALGAGLLLGLAILTRPVALLLPLTLALVIPLARFLRQRRWQWSVARGALILLGTAALFPLVWSARNYRQTGHFAFSPLTGYNLALHNLPTLRDLDARRVYAEGSPEGEFCKTAAQTGNIPSALVKLTRDFNLDVFGADRVAKRVALEAIAKEPLRYLKNTVAYGIRIFIAPSDGLDFLSAFLGEKPWLVTPLGQALRERLWPAIFVHLLLRAVFFVFLILIPAALLGHRVRKGEFGDPELWVMLAAMGYFVFFSAAFIPTNGRFLLPIFPALYFIYTNAVKTAHMPKTAESA